MKTKIILKSTLPLSITVILFFVVGFFGISAIGKIRSAIASSQNDQNILTQKLNLLQTFSQSVVAGADVATLTLPVQDPTLTVLSQLRVLAAENGLLFSRFGSSEVKESASGLNEVSISFDLEGPIPQIISFLTGTATLAPVIILDKVDFNQKDSNLLTGVTIRSFWSPLPATIPALTQPVTDLTPVEKETLTKIMKLSQPVSGGSQEVTGSATGINPNPFGQ